ncbi:ribosomal-processing cysteine protease Prp [Absicoccus intestinalis]|uniref:Ribosomal processing cysteine protease Prp n=1 Tax=Absicoccus intestinalis TaxID=2926319 RepID=A0ABU4WMX1_9FIRM|nr:ribosomal-processing cysteine protease Prp [Absicoccus sp. CLA-KB-P134]MDX8417915.1 ribosomal-processing cysteine protease Prp [Absicoccus sp. CLA-KB-P134]
MIHITIKYDEWFDIQIEGHAGYAPKGKDIVCAAVSALYQTLVQTIQTRHYGELKHIRSNDGFEHVLIDAVTEEGVGAIMAFITGCEEIASIYQDHVRVDNELT